MSLNVVKVGVSRSDNGDLSVGIDYWHYEFQFFVRGQEIRGVNAPLAGGRSVSGYLFHW